MRRHHGRQKETSPMIKNDFAEQLRAQADVWRAQLKDYQQQAEQASDKVRADYKAAVAQLEKQSEEARKLLEKVQAANEAAWGDMQSATQKALVELQRGWQDALSRFNK
jgi:hypothetical protein